MSDELRHDAELFETAAERTSAVPDRVNSVLSTRKNFGSVQAA